MPLRHLSNSYIDSAGETPTYYGTVTDGVAQIFDTVSSHRLDTQM